jgi:hypothetical protein
LYIGLDHPFAFEVGECYVWFGGSCHIVGSWLVGS